MKKEGKSTEVLFILDKDTDFLLAEVNFAYRKVCSKAELEASTEHLPQFQSIVVLAELGWKEKSQELFYGFEIATSLRRSFRLSCPILITSSFEKRVFESLSRKNQEKFNILYGAGTAFLYLETLFGEINAGNLEEYLDNLSSISDAVIEDMIEMLFQQKGFLIDRITHDLKFFLKEAELKEAFDTIGTYLSYRQKEILNYYKYSKEINKAHQNKEEVAFNAAKENLVSACGQYLRESSEDTEIEESDVTIGKVLIVEDDPEQLKLMTNNLQNHFQLQTTGDGRRAIEILKGDTENGILAIIADWRLLKFDKTGKPSDYWQDYQGYQVLEAASHSHFAALISLTAELERNVHQIRNRLGIAIQLFKKQHIYASGGNAQWEMLIDIVRNKCMEVAALIAAIPTAANWRKFSDHYRKVRMSVQWSRYNHDVSELATQYWEYFNDCLNFQTRPNVNQGLQDVLPLNNLKNVLIGRRLFLALYYEFLRLRNDATISYNPEQIIRIEGEERGSAILDTYAVLRNNWWDPGISDEKGNFKLYNQASKNLLKDLCIKSEEISRMLPEEKAWLLKKGIDYTIQSVKFEPDLERTLKEDQEATIGEKEPTLNDLKNIEMLPEENFDDELTD